MIQRALPLLPQGSVIRQVATTNQRSGWWAGLLALLGASAILVPAMVLDWSPPHPLAGWTLVYTDLALPLALALEYLLICLVRRRVIIAVTDRSVFLLDGGRLLPWTPRRPVETLARTQLGPVWRGRLTIGDRRLLVYDSWSREIQAADWDLFTRDAPPALATADGPAAALPALGSEVAPPAGLRVSDDGRWTWEGSSWRPIRASAPAGARLSPDGLAWWDGEAWRVRPAGSLAAT